VIKEKITHLLEKETGIQYLLTNEKRVDLGRLHKLTAGIQSCQVSIAAALIKHVKAEGEVIISDKIRKNEQNKNESPEDPEFVKALMKLQARFKSLLAESFKNDSTYQRALNSGFEEIVNKRIGKYTFAEILACFADKLLKKTNNRMTEVEVEASLSSIIELFEHLEDKHLFAEIFKNQLAKRLLNDLSANEDAEKSIISKMKMCCGSQYTAKMEGMLTDLHLSEDIKKNYNERPHSLPIEFSVQVLTFSYWPFFNNSLIQLPTEMEICKDNFKQFYSEITQHRKLY
jgi:Cullin, a subunit of E3 ubiquitin ligase